MTAAPRSPTNNWGEGSRLVEAISKGCDEASMAIAEAIATQAIGQWARSTDSGTDGEQSRASHPLPSQQRPEGKRETRDYRAQTQECGLPGHGDKRSRPSAPGGKGKTQA